MTRERWLKSVRRTLLLGCVAAMGSGAVACETPLTTERVVAGLSSPVFVTAPPGDDGRLFIVEQGGSIRIYDLVGGTMLATPFITIPVTSGGERGLLGLAFDPNYADNGHFFVDYTRLVEVAPGQLRLFSFVSRFSVSAADPNLADPASELEILQVQQPYDNHNGGWIAFGPDGYLYIAFGDGGSGGDPGNRAQDITDQLLGKMLRLDVSNATQEEPYAIPADNPFIGVAGDDEIWAYGLRNPWRDSFDRVTGELYIADVGQGTREEVDVQPADSIGGQNYGWRCYEGSIGYDLTGCPPASTMVFPIHEYTHGGSPFRCSITGGYVYRGAQIWDLAGTYFFADYCSNQIWTFRYVDGSVTDFRDRTSELDPPSYSINDIVSFGEDAAGNLYIVDHGGEIFRVVPNGPVVGDLNGDGQINAFDIEPFALALVDPAAYAEQYPEIDPDVTGDVNCDEVLDAFDIDPFVELLAGR